MRIAETDLQMPYLQVPTNTDKGKDVLVEAPNRHPTRLAQCIISVLQVGKKTTLVFFVINLMFMFLYFSSRLHSSCMNFISLAVWTNYVCFAPPSSVESAPSLSSPYMQQNVVIFRAISYEVKLYADFVFNSEEEQR